MDLLPSSEESSLRFQDFYEQGEHKTLLGAVVTTPEIAQVMAQKIQFNTFGGNPVCSSGGLAVLKVMDKEKRQMHCSDVGSHLIDRLRGLQQKHEIIGDVRGRGLMVGIELVTDRKEKTPAKG